MGRIALSQQRQNGVTLMVSKKLMMQSAVDVHFKKAFDAYINSSSDKLSPYIKMYMDDTSLLPDNARVLSRSSLYELFKYLVDPIENIERLHGKGAKKLALKSVVNRYSLSGDNRRSEMDALRTPIAIQHPKKYACLGMPLEYTLIDVKFRGIPGHLIDFSGAGENSAHVIALLIESLIPKPRRNTKLDVNRDFAAHNPFYGLTDIVANDPGSAFVSKNVMQFNFQFMINQLVEISATPWLRPFIERFFYTYVTLFVCKLPGYLPETNGYAEGKRDMLSLSVLNPFEYKILSDRFRNNIYHNRPHKGLFGKTPLEKLNEIDPYMRAVLPHRANEMVEYFVPYKQATLTKDRGIQIDQRFYHSSDITNSLFRKIKLRNLSLKLWVYINLNDLSTVKISTPFDDYLIEIPFSAYVPGIDPDEQFHRGISSFVDEEIDRINSLSDEDIIDFAKRRTSAYKKIRREARKKEQGDPIQITELNLQHAEIAFSQRLEKSILPTILTNSISAQVNLADEDDDFDIETERSRTMIG